MWVVDVCAVVVVVVRHDQDGGGGDHHHHDDEHLDEYWGGGGGASTGGEEAGQPASEGGKEGGVCKARRGAWMHGWVDGQAAGYYVSRGQAGSEGGHLSINRPVRLSSTKLAGGQQPASQGGREAAGASQPTHATATKRDEKRGETDQSKI